ncbi:FAD-binding oxidoreductase [Rhodobacter sp. Har01]|uniref:NAD(P)/FAD-dependent oxidoreductase n=1 Tax=Rhodobacter sp. Har01 TaxID=2883999 RepID=UPI001D07B5E3|nr:FAD-binding oxidoreductase [Rhodobacter sp. Har01]MCB6177601.1 FAD-binding oxidoreductase [Rhodobacter sp. Har01]
MTFPITDRTPIRFPGPPPADADVVVIGGGVIGVMTAWFLRDQGLRVTLCEKGRIAGEQSSRNWGWVRQQGRDPAELPIMVESMRIWQRLAQEIGPGLGFRQTGVLYLADSVAQMARYEGWLPHARANGVDTRALSAAQVAALLPQAARTWTGGLWTASDARAEPWVAVPTLAQAAARRGVTLVESCAVRALDIAAGRVAGVVTEQGRIRAGRVVVAAGAWSRLFLGAHGVRLPQLSVLATVAATAALPSVFDGAATDSAFAFRRRADGGYTLAPSDHHDFFPGRDALASLRAFWPVVQQDWRHTVLHPFAPKGFPDAWSTPRRWSPDAATPFERCRILNPAPNGRIIQRLRDDFALRFPALGRPPLTAAWAGMIDTLPDVVPVVDHVAAIPGLTVATGMSGHGFGIGPGMGRVVAALVTGTDPGHDLSRFRLARFSDGTRLRPGPSL